MLRACAQSSAKAFKAGAANGSNRNHGAKLFSGGAGAGKRFDGGRDRAPELALKPLKKANWKGQGRCRRGDGGPVGGWRQNQLGGTIHDDKRESNHRGCWSTSTKEKNNRGGIKETLKRN